ncbi:hypothetical protein Pst134EB_001711 [Puccinia striiformis f. sp. tritici]|uniref:Uncharacterized protein n=1 Tax=Puccinia striiformis f. sp. tritici PST-78 TaxID=1165861 RepID=A0A0L0V283_9BASI|nr:hypothetical protein Pst134EB_001711 [Puccinia striiformis f. sp. tritici]KNE93403.1 hypothetical protein PSTG_13226 [Puccinia striiformis f. sp. tritici PST-78]
MPTLSRSYERAFKHNPSLTLAITNGCLKCFGDLLAQFLPAFSSGQPFVLDVHRSLRFFLFGFLHGPCVGKWHEFLERRIPLRASRVGNSVMGGGVTQIEAEEEDLRLIETEKSLTNHRPISIRSRSAPTEHTLRTSSSPVSDTIPSHDLKSKSNPTNTGGFRLFGLLKRILLDQLVMAPLYTFLFISLTGWFEGLTIPEIRERLHELYWYLLTANWKIWPLIQIFNFSFMPLQYRVPWQGSCGVLWTVFLSLSTHSKTTSTTHFSSITTSSTTPSLIATAFSKLFQSHFNSSTSSSSENSPASIDSDTINNSSTTDFSSQIKRKNNRVIG